MIMSQAIAPMQGPVAADLRTPVHILTGFLGSGKTTLLRGLLADDNLIDTAVVINEFGEVGLDHLLVRELAEDVVLLSSGCICCTVGDDLAATLAELHALMRAGRIPPFARLVVETTGMADPMPIMQAIMGDQRVTAHYRLGQVISTVDAVNGEATAASHHEARQQLAAADRIVLSKADLAPADEISALSKRLAQRNPTAQIFVSGLGRHPAAALLENLDQVWDRPEAATASTHDCESGAHAHTHAHTVHTFTLTLSKPVGWDRFVEWLELLLLARGHSILRVKGILQLEGQEQAVVIQGVQHLLYPVEHLPAQSGTDSWIVFIVQNITREAIEQSLASITHAQAAGWGSSESDISPSARQIPSDSGGHESHWA